MMHDRYFEVILEINMILATRFIIHRKIRRMRFIATKKTDLMHADIIVKHAKFAFSGVPARSFAILAYTLPNTKLIDFEPLHNMINLI